MTQFARSRVIAVSITLVFFVIPSPTNAQLLQVFSEPNPASTNQLGGAVVGVDGLVGVSAPGNDILGRINSVYLFDPDTGDVVTSITQPVTGRRFGDSLAALPGALVIAYPNAILTPGNGAVQGAVYVVDADIESAGFGNIVRTFISPQSDPQLGQSLATNGTTLFIGAGNSEAANKVYRFDGISGASLGTISDPVQGTNYFGNSIATVGSEIIVGARRTDVAGATDAGAAHVFNAATGGFVRTLTSPTPTGNFLFGTEVAISDTLFAVADRSAVYLFSRATGGFVRKIQPFGFDCFDRCSLAVRDEKLVMGSPSTGAVFVYDMLTGSLIVQLPPPVAGSNYFGYATAWYGNRVLVGAPLTDFVPPVGSVKQDAGEAYLYAIPPQTTPTPLLTATPTRTPTPTPIPTGTTPTPAASATAVPSDEVIVFGIEEPSCAGSAGISNIRGYAFTTRLDAEIQRLIEVVIDRGTQSESQASIPCCSSRGDVSSAFPGAPVLSGFSGIFNWCLLSPGIHTISLTFHSSTGKTVTATREFISRCEHPGDPFITQNEFGWRFGSMCLAGDGGSAVFKPAADICDGEVRYEWSQAAQALTLKTDCVTDGANPPVPPACDDMDRLD